ncbi:MAG: GNAT family N-acetyltransferase [Novosphingobium sp.]|nr:GNAT family N-acetyltransferase [Novosphingobium sp.]
MESATWRDLVDDVAAWDRLATEAVEPNPFLESWYLLPSLQAYDPQGHIRILRFDHGGKLAGILPVASQRRYYGKPIPHLSGWQHDNIFLGAPLVEAGREIEFWKALLGWSDRNAGMALFLHLSQMSLDGPLMSALETVLATQAREGALVRREERAILSSGMNAAEYRAAVFSSNKRKDLRRRSNRLAELGEVRFEWQDDASDIERWCAQFLTLEASGWKGEAGSAMVQDQAKRAVFTQSLTGAAERDRLLRLALLLNGEPVAMLSTFVTPPGAFGYKTAFDEDYSRFAPGILLEQEFMAVLDQQRFDWCDSCAATDHPVMNDIWRERRAIGKISIAIGGKLRRQLFKQLIRHERGQTALGVRQ